MTCFTQVNIGTLEMFYSEAPESMRSTASALQLVTVALGNYLSSALVSIVTGITTRGGAPGWIPNNLNFGRVDLFYTLLVVLSVLNYLFFLVIARYYKYREVCSQC
jgi:peptide/histidine transporter 3/4